MDLTDVMREASIIDHSWAGKPGGMTTGDEPLIDVESLKKHNNIKPELEVQWGGGGPEIDIDEPAGVVQRNLGDESPDVNSVIVFARDMMNRGFMGRDLNRVLRSKFAVETLKAAAKELGEQLKLEGIVGCIAVDGRGYKNCKMALESAQQSPYKGLIKYVIGCECGTPHDMPRAPKGSLIGVGDSTGSAVDDFLADSRIHRAEMVSVCRSTALPILGQTDDLDPSDVKDGLIDLMTLTALPPKKAEEFLKQGGIQALRAAFRWTQKNREAAADGKYEGGVDASGHVLEASQPVVEINAPPQRDIDIDGSAPSKSYRIAVDNPGPSTRLDAPMSLGSELVVELGRVAQGALDVVPRGPLSDIELTKKAQKAADVDIQPHLSGMFAGTDEIELDAKKVHAKEMDVEF